jgi:Undecaprenyl-phosphate glucose phosphotransferase
MSHFSLTDVWPPTQKSRSTFQYISYRRIGAFTASLDYVLIALSSLITGVAYNFILFESVGDIQASLATGICCGLIFVLLSGSIGLYRPHSLLSARIQMGRVCIAWGAALLFITSIFFLLKIGASFSRGATLGLGCLGFVLIMASRAIIGGRLRRALADGSLAGPRGVVIGDAEELAAKSSLDLLRTYGTREIARFELATASPDSDFAIVDSVISAARSMRAEQVLLALRWGDVSRKEHICERLRLLPLPVLLLPDKFVSSITQGSGQLSFDGAIEVQRAPLTRLDLLLKRVIDVVLAGMCLLVLSPLLFMTSVAIKLGSAGPILFRQRRRGFNGVEFAIYKFRTMTVLEDGENIRQAERNDDRCTWLGRLLRASSIDELPQLFNVLSGEMSLIGPRPHAVAHDVQYGTLIDNYALRHHVKPGITGWAQIHGYRGATADAAQMDKRIQLDLWYIDNWSLWLDLTIMLRTCIELLRPRNAY